VKVTGINVGLGVMVRVGVRVTGGLVLVAEVEVRVGPVGVLVGVLVFVGVRDLVGLGPEVLVEVAVNTGVADLVAAVGIRVSEGVGVGVLEGVSEGVLVGRGVRVGGVAVRRVAVGVILGLLLGS
jgi:hypothetical protein